MNKLLVFCAVTGLLLAGCNPGQPALTPAASPAATVVAPTAAPLPTVTLTPRPFVPLPQGRVIFEISPTRKFAGTASGQGKTAIILAGGLHGSSESVWSPFVGAADPQEFTTLTFGYLQANNPGAVQAASVILDQLRSHGYRRVICIGASLGVAACGSIAAEPEMAGIVMIAGPEDVDHHLGGDCHCASLKTLAYPKLYLAAETDPLAPSTQQLYEQAGEPKTLVIFPGIGNHGTDLFYSARRDDFLKLLIDFVDKARDFQS